MTRAREAKRPISRGKPSRVRSARRVSTRLIGIVAVGVILLVGGGILLVNATQSTAVRPAVGSFAESAVKGSADAKVTITEYSDFQCPYCGQFALNTGRQIDEAYVIPGKVRFVYRNRKLIGDESDWAAAAAYCAGDQGRYWDYHDTLFANQRGENRGTFSNANLKRFAKDLGLDESFASCLDSGKYMQRVRDETAEGVRRGVQGTPTFFINNSRINGALPFEDFKRVIDSELQKAQ